MDCLYDRDRLFGSSLGGVLRTLLVADEVGSGEVSHGRVGPADRVGVRRSLSGSLARRLRSRSRRPSAGGFLSRSCRRWARRCIWPSPRRPRHGAGPRGVRRPTARTPAITASWAAAGVVDPARSHSRSARAGAVASRADRAALGVAAADPGGALSPRLPAAASADEARRPQLACIPGVARRGAPADHGRVSDDRRARCASGTAQQGAARLGVLDRSGRHGDLRRANLASQRRQR